MKIKKIFLIPLYAGRAFNDDTRRRMILVSISIGQNISIRRPKLSEQKKPI